MLFYSLPCTGLRFHDRIEYVTIQSVSILSLISGHRETLCDLVCQVGDYFQVFGRSLTTNLTETM
jgi:hypothetical protein